MLHINPIEYPRLIKHSFNVLGISDDKKKIQININAGNARLYYNKVLTFFINNTAYTGIYQVEINRNTYKHYIVLDSPIELTVNDTLTLYETFAVKNDFQLVTLQDVKENLDSTESEVTEFGESKIGSKGLQTGLQTLKANYSLYDFKKDVNVQITNSFVKVCDLEISKTRLSRYRILLYSTESKGIFDGEFVFAPNADYVFVKLITHIDKQKSTELNEINFFTFKLLKNNYANGKIFVSVNIGLDSDSDISSPYNFVGFIGCKSYNDLILPTDSTVTDSTVLKLNNKELVECDRTLVSIDTFGEQRVSKIKETLFNGVTLTNSDLICKQTPGYYIMTNSLPNDIPGGITDKSIVKDDIKIKSDFTSANLIIYPTVNLENNPSKDNDNCRCLMITNNKRIFIGVILRTENYVEWIELTTGLNNATHAKDIITDSTHRFVTDEQIKKWNDSISVIVNTPWRPTVNNKSELPTENIQNGYTTTVLNDDTYGNQQVIYQFKNDEWKPVSINVLKVDNQQVNDINTILSATLVSSNLLNDLKYNGIAYKIDDEQFGSVMNKTKYGTTTNKFIDLVKRAEYDLIPGNESINIGFSNELTKNYNILIGSSLQNTKENSIAIGTNLLCCSGITLGKFNINVPDAQLIIGNGSDNDNRSNLVWFDFDGNLNLPTGKLIKIAGLDTNQILTSGGTIDKSTFLTKDSLKDELDNKADADKFGFFKHELVDGTKLTPIVFISGLYQSYEEFDEDSPNFGN